MKTVLFLLIFSFSVTAHALEKQWVSLFTSTYFSESVYEENRCGDNIRRFLRLGRSQGLNLNQVEVIEIVNKGISNFGMVGAQNVRGQDKIDPSANWFHHVIFKVGNTILDYDFTRKPTPTSVKSYFESMYMTARMRKDKAYCLQEIGDYELTIYSGSEHLEYYDNKRSSDDISKEVIRLKKTDWACR